MSAETITQAEAATAPEAKDTTVLGTVTATQPASDKPSADAPEPSAGDQEQAAVEAPESYEFKSPEGREPYAPELLVAFGEVAKKHGLTQDAAQGVLDDMAPTIVQRMQDARDTQVKTWAEEVANDDEIGRGNSKQALKNAGLVLDKFGTPALREWLNKSGVGNNPELVRVFARAGKHFAQDTVVTGSPPPAKEASLGEMLFPSAVRKKE